MWTKFIEQREKDAFFYAFYFVVVHKNADMFEGINRRGTKRCMKRTRLLISLDGNRGFVQKPRKLMTEML